MTFHIYAFGSVCRGEVDHGSDIDLLACSNELTPQIDITKYSLYKYDRLRQLWAEGNPFAWHLHLESKLLFSSDSVDFIASLGVPSNYSSISNDFAKFSDLFEISHNNLMRSSNSETFHLACIFLAIRNLATCYSLAVGKPNFSRRSALMVNPVLDINPANFLVLTRARILSTRGYGEKISSDDIQSAKRAVVVVPEWITKMQSEL